MAAAALPDYHEIDRQVMRSMDPPGWKYWLWIGALALIVAWAVLCWARQIYVGLGVTGLREPNMWAVYITNFVFWVGIALPAP